MNTVWNDSTVVKANIHFPVDWVLLVDAVRTLMKATTLIRREGLKIRMGERFAELLITNGADVNAKDESGTTPLQIAAERGHSKMTEILKKKKKWWRLF